MIITFTPHFVGQNLTGQDQGQIFEFLRKLFRDPTTRGLNVEHIQGARDRRVRTARVNDFWRAVMFELPDRGGYVIDAVLPHDPANNRAVRITMGSDANGTITISEVGAVDSAPVRTGFPVLRIAHDDLVGLGLSTGQAEYARTLTDHGSFDLYCSSLPGYFGEMLRDLVAGRTVEEVRDGYLDEDPPDRGPAGGVGRRLIVPGEERLRQALDSDLRSWRVWLHPMQERLAYHTGWNGPFRVTGGAGTGKTVTALHRSLHLATAPDLDGKVLLVTFTTNLAQALKEQLIDLAGGRDVLEHVDVKSIDSLAHGIANQGNSLARWSVVDPDDDRVKSLWRRVPALPEEERDFAEQEWQEVILAQGVTTPDGYFGADRSGRGRALNRPARARLWDIFDQLRGLLDEDRLLTHDDVTARALARVNADEVAQYRHAVLDEAQDLRPVHWKLLRALTVKAADDMFIAGDGNQRIYGRQVALSRFGIDTRGRSRRLTVNYRTSDQILESCLSVANLAPNDDLDGGDETNAGARSVLRGPPPELSSSPTPQVEQEAVVQRVKDWMAEGFSRGDIAVVCPTIATTFALRTTLEAAGVRAGVIDGNTEQGDAVAVMTMHRVKGLEFRCVAIPGLGRPDFPVGDEYLRQHPRRRALLYVAMSRAREQLALFADEASDPGLRHLLGLSAARSSS